MNDLEKNQIKKWVDTWKRAGSALHEIKCKELQSFEYSKNRKIIDEMLQWAHDNRQVRLTSGFIEQQHYFMKMKTGYTNKKT